MEGRNAFKIYQVNLQKRDFSEGLDEVRKDTAIKYLKEFGKNTRNWVDSTQDKDYWRFLVNATSNFWVP